MNARHDHKGRAGEILYLCFCLLITGVAFSEGSASSTVVLSSLPGCGNTSSPQLVGSLFACNISGSIMPGDSITYTWTVPAAGAANFSLHAIVRALQSAVTLQIESSVTPPIQLGVTYIFSSMDYIAGGSLCHTSINKTLSLECRMLARPFLGV